MEQSKAKSRRRWLLFRKASFFFGVFAATCVVVAVLVGYLRFRIEKLSLAYETLENVRREKELVEEVAAAELRYNDLFSRRRLSALAKKKGFREPRHSDFIYEPPASDNKERQ